MLALLIGAGTTYAFSGARCGSFEVPALPLEWLLLAAGAAFLLAPATTRPFSPRRFAGLAGILAAAALGLGVWSRSLFESSPALLASISRPSSAQVEKNLLLERIQIPQRRDLNRLAGRRRDVALQISGYLAVSETGRYRFLSSCDDRCVIRIGEVELVASPLARSTAIDLDRGAAPISVSYMQSSGPAWLRLDWERPAFFELLPLDFFLLPRPDPSGADRLRAMEWEALAHRLALSLWWAAALALLLRAAEEREHGRRLLTRPVLRRVAFAGLAGILVYASALRLAALAVRAGWAEGDDTALRLLQTALPFLPDYALFDSGYYTVSPYRADVRSYLDRAEEMTLSGFYEASFREPFYVALVKLFVGAAGGREVGILVQSFVFSVAALVLAGWIALREAGPWWALAALLPLGLHEWLILEAPTGYRMSAYSFFLLALVGWFLSRGKRSVGRHAIGTGVLGAAVCLIRLSGLSFVLPLVAFEAWRIGGRPGARYALLSAALALAFIGPFLWSSYRTTGDPFYAVSFHTRFWLEAEGRDSAPVGLYDYLIGSRAASEVAAGTLRGLTVLPVRTFWRGLAHFPLLDAATLLLGVAGLAVLAWRRERGLVLPIAYFGHLVPFAYIQNFPSGEMPRFVMPAYFFLVLAGVLAGRTLSLLRPRDAVDPESECARV